MLNELLPYKKYEPYPAYAELNSKVMLIFPRLDSVYLFDYTTEKGKSVAKNELKVVNTSLSLPVSYAFGKYKNYLYVYEKASCQLKRINLLTYQWEIIRITQEIKNILSDYTSANGAVFDGLLLLFKNNSKVAICYDIEKDIWGYSNINYPNSIFYESRFTTDTEFYYLNTAIGPSPCEVGKLTRMK
jgi:hypothetical protein